jgi:glutathione S-transferase
MITLYINPNCPFCRKTVETAQALGVPLTLKDIHEEGVSEELVMLGGKKQMPYMVDDEGDSMYESDDIMSYLHTKFGKKR